MDLLVLAALKERSRFRQLRGAVPDDLIGMETVAMLGWFKAYFDAFPDAERVDVKELRSLFVLRVSKDTTPEQHAIMNNLFRQLEQPVDQSSVDTISTQLYERDFAGRAAALLHKYESGGEIDVTYELNRLASENLRRISASAPAAYVDAPIEEILGDFQGDKGLKLVTTVLQETVGGLQGGDSVAVAARPDKGKSSLLAACLVNFAPQLDSMGWSGRPMLWLSNEGAGRRLVPRIYQAAIGCTFQEMVDKSNAGTLRGEYDAAMHGQCIRVKDAHGMTLGQIEQVIEDMNPCVVVFDMIANIRSSAVVGGNKTDALEALWQEVREMAVRHDFVALSTIQISADGDNLLYPAYSALKDSRTGVQGATDVILMMGALNDPMMDEVRGFSTPKNKRQMMGKPSNVQAQVFFDKARCRFSDGIA